MRASGFYHGKLMLKKDIRLNEEKRNKKDTEISYVRDRDVHEKRGIDRQCISLQIFYQQ